MFFFSFILTQYELPSGNCIGHKYTKYHNNKLQLCLWWATILEMFYCQCQSSGSNPVRVSVFISAKFKHQSSGSNRVSEYVF